MKPTQSDAICDPDSLPLRNLALLLSSQNANGALKTTFSEKSALKTLFWEGIDSSFALSRSQFEQKTLDADYSLRRFARESLEGVYSTLKKGFQGSDLVIGKGAEPESAGPSQQIEDFKDLDETHLDLVLSGATNKSRRKTSKAERARKVILAKRVSRRIAKHKHKCKQQKPKNAKYDSRPSARRDTQTFLSVSGDEVRLETNAPDSDRIAHRQTRVLNQILTRIGRVSALSGLLSKLGEQNIHNLKFLETLESHNSRKSIANSRHTDIIVSKIKNLRTSLRLENAEMIKQSKKVCQVCSLGECIYKGDVFIYCEYCNVMVHRICVGLSVRAVKTEPWVCEICAHRAKMVKEEAWISYFFDIYHMEKGIKHSTAISKKLRKPALKSLSNVRRRLPKNRRVLKNFKTSLDLKIRNLDRGPTELRILKNLAEHCVACGRLGGVLYRVGGIDGYFCHMSCGYWQSQLSLNVDRKQIIFVDHSDLMSREKGLTRGFQADSREFYLSSAFWALDREIKAFFTRKSAVKSFKLLVSKTKLIKRGTEAYLAKIKTHKSKCFSKRRLNNIRKRLAISEPDSTCNCLFKGPILNFAQTSIRKHFIAQIRLLGFDVKNRPPRNKFPKKKKKEDLKDLAAKISKILNGEFYALFPFKSSRKNRNYKSLQDQNEISKNDKCKECNLLPTKSCVVCGAGKGLLVTCIEKGCCNSLHVECGRRVSCELVCPLEDSLEHSGHQIYCHLHSKTEDLRKREIMRLKIIHDEKSFRDDMKHIWSQYAQRDGESHFDASPAKKNNSHSHRHKQNNISNYYASNGVHRRGAHKNRHKQEAQSGLHLQTLPFSCSSIFTQKLKTSSHFSEAKKIIWHLQKIPNLAALSDKTSVFSESSLISLNNPQSPRLIRNLSSPKVPSSQRVRKSQKEKKGYKKDLDSIVSAVAPKWYLKASKKRVFSDKAKEGVGYKLALVQFENRH